MQKAGRNAFTLLELLVVITICAILAALLSRQYGAIRENGWSSRCKANLRSLYQAAVNYTVEHGGTYPNAGSWEWFDTSDSMWKESRNGWVNWVQFTGTGSWHSPTTRASLMATRWDGNSGRDSIKAGVLWEYTMNERGIYYCPKFCTLKRGVDVARSYFMNSKYGCDADKTSINWASDRDEASRKLLFADMQPQTKYLGSATDVCIKWAGSTWPTTYGGVADDGVLNGATAAGWPIVTEESIGYIHRMGGDYYGHVIFADGHIEAVGMRWNALLQDRTGAWTNRTYDACIGKF